ncbi:DUF2092 domain-containing protein [Herbiconiux sp. 11R-BC]|uniref:LolA family protein n=1 Tax=Herbiconiux sp. 11R-BC TaxID=3111637 RepID=UPI003BFD699E
MARKWQRWIPAMAAPVVVAAVVAGGAFASSASADLPPKTAQQVLELAAQANVQAFSGTVEQSSNLELPDLSSVPGGASTSGTSGSSSGGAAGSADSTTSAVTTALGFLTGSHSARVYTDGSNGRVQILDQLAERDAVRNGSDLWLYDSSANSVVHSTLPSGSTGADASSTASPSPDVETPAQLAQKFLDAVTPSTDVSLGADTSVAGRSAYDLVLTPRSSDTLVGSVSIAVDSETGMPLSVEVLDRSSSAPAFSVAFSSLSLDTPSADVFAFTPPAGATVTEQALPGTGHDATAPDAGSAHPKPTVTGSGWDAIVSLPLGSSTSSLTSSPLFSQLTTPVDGGSVLQTTLVTVLLTDDGRVFAGAVPVEALQAAAAAAPAPADATSAPAPAYPATPGD